MNEFVERLYDYVTDKVPDVETVGKNGFVFKFDDKDHNILWDESSECVIDVIDGDWDEASEVDIYDLEILLN